MFFSNSHHPNSHPIIPRHYLLVSFMAPTDKDVYIKRFSALKKGAPLYHPCEVQVGDVGFIDEQDGFFQKLYNIADPPRNLNPGCPPPINLETTSLTEQWDAIHVCYLSCFITENCLIS
jgi:hypothetical protein